MESNKVIPVSEDGGKVKKQKAKKIIDIAAIVLVIILFLLGVSTIAITISKKDTGVPSLFGVTFLDIQTDSMKGTINPGDIAVIVKPKGKEDITKDTIITFKTMMDTNGDGTLEEVLNTHRVIRVIEGEEPRYETKGDNTAGADAQLLAFNDIVGVYKFRLPAMGHFSRFMQGWGFLIIVIIPLAAFLVYRIVILVQASMAFAKEKRIAAGTDTETNLKVQLEKEREAQRIEYERLQAELQILRAKAEKEQQENK